MNLPSIGHRVAANSCLPNWLFLSLTVAIALPFMLLGCGETPIDVSVTLGETAGGSSLRFSITPEFGGPPLSITTTANPGGEPLPAGQYCWTFDELQPACGPRETHAVWTFIFSQVGIHTVSLVVYADDGTIIEGTSLQTGGPIAGAVVLSEPTVHVTADPTSGAAPLTVRFEALASDPDGAIVGYTWDFGDGSRIGPIELPEGQGIPQVIHLYNSEGVFEATLVVADNDGGLSNATVSICVGDCCDSPDDCNDGTFCNGTESCVNGRCLSGIAPCSGRQCDEDGDRCVDCLNDGHCDDGQFCNGTEACINGSCQPGAIPCLGQQCDETGDQCVACLNDSHCNDAIYCDGAEICVNHECRAGLAPCSLSECDEAVDSCVECLTNGECDDRVFCNGAEVCVAGICQLGANPCPGQSCVEFGDSCVDCLADNDCDDGVFCNGIEDCQSGSCTAGTDPCPGQFCDEADTTCVDCLADSDCDDSTYCNGTETCVAGACVAGADPCPGATCLEAGDQCVDCVSDQDCDDGQFCNGAESCAAGTCQAGDDACPGEECDESSDSCLSCRNNNQCSDGIFCNGAEICVNGTCQNGVAVCPGRFCDEVDNACVNCLDDSDCEDGDFCNGAESCVNGSCQSGNDPCSGGLCDESLNACVECLNNIECDDGSFCNGSETCSQGSCGSGADPCPGQLCDESGNECVDCLANSDCDDENFCNGNESCENGACQIGANSCPGQQCNEASDTCFDSDCITSSASWQNSPIGPLTGTFEVTFDVTPSAGSIDAIISMASAPGSSFSDFATLIRFDSSGSIDARNGGTYAADTSVSYTAGSTYHFRMEVNVPVHTYSVYVRAEGAGSETTLASNYAFRSEQSGVTALSNWGAWSDLGSVDVCGFSAATGPLSASAGPDKTVFQGASTTLEGSASGGSGVYAFSWSPTAGLNDSSAARPSASPNQNTIYTLTVSDSEGASDADSVTVTVEAAPLSAIAGPDKAITPGGSVVLEGNAIGGDSPYLYSWSPSTGLNNPNIAQPTASPNQTTSYTLTVTDGNGDTDSDSTTVSEISGDIFYVDKDHPSANDGNAGTESAPWRTLNKAASTAQAGDTVLIKAGVYSESLSPANSGAAGAYISFQAHPSDECAPNSDHITPPSCSVVIDGSTVDLNLKSYIRIQGLEIRNQGGEGIFFQNRDQDVVSHIEILNNYIHDTGGDGIQCRNAHDSLIAYNFIKDTGGSAGIRFTGDRMATNLTIRGNSILHVGCDGMDVQGTNIIIEDNFLGDSWHTGCHQDALEVYGPVDGLIIRNNRMWDWTQHIYLSAEDDYVRNVEVLGNVVWCDQYCDAGNDAPGFALYHPTLSNVRIEGNTFYRVWSIDGGHSGSLVIRNNIFHGGPERQGADFSTQYASDNLYYRITDSHNGEQSSILDQDPLFVNEGAFDFRLLPSSPAIDAGIDVIGLENDPDGVPRPQGGAFDLGAYEQ